MIVRDFQAIIGRETREQCLEVEGRLPDYVVACVGGGSNAAGIFAPFVADESVKLIGVEAGGRGIALGQHAATLAAGKPGVLHGSLVLCFAGRRRPNRRRASASRPDSIIPASARSTRIGKTPAAWNMSSITDDEALDAFQNGRPAGRNSARAGIRPRVRPRRRSWRRNWQKIRSSS